MSQEARGSFFCHRVNISSINNIEYIVECIVSEFIRTKAYIAWVNMKQRCYNPSQVSYPYYGGKGIEVCQRWKESFDNFLEDMGNPPSNEYSLDRIDGNGDYLKENCRWATPKQQENNRNDNARITLNDLTLTLGEWAEVLGVNKGLLEKRYYRGWKPEKMLTKKLYKRW